MCIRDSSLSLSGWAMLNYTLGRYSCLQPSNCGRVVRTVTSVISTVERCPDSGNVSLLRICNPGCLFTLQYRQASPKRCGATICCCFSHHSVPFQTIFFFFTLLCILFVCKLLTRSLVYVIVANLVFVLVCNPSYQVSTQNVDSAAGTLEHL